MTNRDKKINLNIQNLISPASEITKVRWDATKLIFPYFQNQNSVVMKSLFWAEQAVKKNKLQQFEHREVEVEVGKRIQVSGLVFHTRSAQFRTSIKKKKLR
ncbi:5195_t:CDS:2 [Funneliformis mosseae]|uniref:5195_t:CDS:1 n=1 Tax=Funneliformis mosseae TaxID=27381 RepID=A0A9N9CSI5_FUNMO|nr:5195_t:CDS:2 [Funneliformis mosseae]